MNLVHASQSGGEGTIESVELQVPTKAHPGYYSLKSVLLSQYLHRNKGGQGEDFREITAQRIVGQVTAQQI